MSLGSGHGQGCPLCGSAKTVDRCESCGLELHATDDGILVSAAGSESIKYPEEGNELTMQVEEESFWFRHRNRAIAALLRNHPVDGSLWDIGGGNGFQALQLQEERPVVMVEPGPGGCAYAKERGVRTVIRSTLEGLSLPPASVAALSYFDVLEHLETPEQTLAESRRVLEEGGKVFITVPAFEFLWSDEDIYARHQRRYSTESLRRELEGAGFSVDYLSYYFQALLLPVYLLRTLPHKLSGKKVTAETATMDQSEHTPPAAFRKALEVFLNRELAVLERGGRLSYGTSVIAVATPHP